MADKKKLSAEQQKKLMAEEMWLHYFNQSLFIKDGITVAERNRITNMIANPKYKDYYVGAIVKVIDMFSPKNKNTSRRKNGLSLRMRAVKSFLPLFPWNCELTNDILKRRNDDVKSRRGIGNHPNVLTGKMISSCCGTPYYRKDS